MNLSTSGNLPMLGHTHGNRSAVTCHLKCDSACASPPPNTSTEPTFAEIATGQLSRRALLIGGGALAATAVAPDPDAPTSLPPPRAVRLQVSAGSAASSAFDPIAPVDAGQGRGHGALWLRLEHDRALG